MSKDQEFLDDNDFLENDNEQSQSEYKSDFKIRNTTYPPTTRQIKQGTKYFIGNIESTHEVPEFRSSNSRKTKSFYSTITIKLHGDDKKIFDKKIFFKTHGRRKEYINGLVDGAKLFLTSEEFAKKMMEIQDDKRNSKRTKRAA